MVTAIHLVTGAKPDVIWHRETSIAKRIDFIALPGGFSYGDYLRSGAMAAHSPVMRAVAQAAARGVPVLGVCNGFQMLTEAGLLPGALMRNAGIRFVCRDVLLTVENSKSLFTAAYQTSDTITLPVAHHEGNYFADEETLGQLEGEGRIAFRYAENINGSARNIAGVLSSAGNILGMMPHPERALEMAHGGSDGRRLFETALGVLNSDCPIAKKMIAKKVPRPEHTFEVAHGGSDDRPPAEAALSVQK